MDHQAIAQLLGNYGEFVGAIGVVASFIFLGIQIRQNTIATLRSNARQIGTEHSRTLRCLMDEGISDIILRGLEKLDGLTPHEKYRFDLALSSWLEIVEQAYADAAAGAFPQDLIVAYRNRLSLIDTGGGRQWWANNRAWMSPSFRTIVDGILEEGIPEEMKSGMINQPTN